METGKSNLTERNDLYILKLFMKYNDLVRFKMSLGDISVEHFYENYLSENDKLVWNETRQVIQKSSENKKERF